MRRRRDAPHLVQTFEGQKTSSFGVFLTRAVESDFRKSNKSRIPKSF